MSQATLAGPQQHPLAEAHRVERIVADPSTWLHHDGDRCRCAYCGDRIHLAGGDHLVVTLAFREYPREWTELLRFCAPVCYRLWAQDASAGWE